MLFKIENNYTVIQKKLFEQSYLIKSAILVGGDSSGFGGKVTDSVIQIVGGSFTFYIPTKSFENYQKNNSKASIFTLKKESDSYITRLPRSYGMGDQHGQTKYPVYTITDHQELTAEEALQYSF